MKGEVKMFDDINDKTVGQVKEDFKKLAEDVMKDVDDVVTTIITEAKEILRKNKDDLNDIMDDLSDVGSKAPKSVIEDIIDTVAKRINKK